jgi:antitoxin component of MazEF toxin-antitoxin module
MTQLSIRQSGGANIVSIPKVILKSLNLHTGSSLELSIVDHKIILTPVMEKLSLEALLEASPKTKLAKTKEDRDWLNSKSAGKEEL